jgi:hypothetical protein
MPAPVAHWLSANGSVHRLEGETTVGRGSNAGFRLVSNTVGRIHCRVFEAQGRWWVEDSRSSGGTWVERAKVLRQVLEDGDFVQIGTTGFRFHEGTVTAAPGFSPRRWQLLTGALLPLAMSSPALQIHADAEGRYFATSQTGDSLWVNGRQGHEPMLLVDGAWVISALGEAFQVQLSEPSPGLSAEQVQLIAQAPGDDGRWRVCIDQLLERGDPLAEPMQQGAPRSREEERRWAGPVAHLWAQGLFEARYVHGFARRMMVREPVGNAAVAPISKRLELALAWPRAKFLRELHFEVQQPAQLLPALEWLPSLPLPPTLERISCGPWQRGELNDSEVERVQQAAARLRRRYPNVFFDEHEVLGSSLS